MNLNDVGKHLSPSSLSGKKIDFMKFFFFEDLDKKVAHILDYLSQSPKIISLEKSVQIKG